MSFDPQNANDRRESSKAKEYYQNVFMDVYSRYFSITAGGRFTNLGVSWVRSETGPIYRQYGESKERGRPHQTGRQWFNKQGNLHIKVVLGAII